jgi:hypothetical protein
MLENANPSSSLSDRGGPLIPEAAYSVIAFQNSDHFVAPGNRHGDFTRGS